MTEQNEIQPTDVMVANAVVPLGGVFGRVERECAAAMLVLACQDRGEWYAVPLRDLQDAVKKHFEDDAYLWLRNPFLKPDAQDLVDCGAAEWVGEPGNPRLRFTADGIRKLAASGWTRRPAQEATQR